MTTYLFPGQGSQTKGMGQTLFAEFQDLVQKADTILGYSIVKLCLENPNEQLSQTQFTQPALYVVNALSYLKKLQTSQKPDYVAGHSLGEYNALFAAEVFDFETGLRLVKKRGELMSEASSGAMAAVIGLKSEQIEGILDQESLNNITIANYNSYTQVVITGPQQAVTTSQALFEKAGATLYIPLKVSGAFHSSYMSKAQQDFTEFLKAFTFNPPSIPVISNVTAKPYSPEEVASLLAQQITSAVHWTNTIEYLTKQGEMELIEVGNGSVLTGLIRRIQNGQ